MVSYHCCNGCWTRWEEIEVVNGVMRALNDGATNVVLFLNVGQ